MAHPEIALTPCQSSRIAAHGFDAQTGTLALQFKAKSGEGSVYHYAGVPADMYEELRAAESIGKFFGERINVKDENGALKYPHTKIVREAAKDLA